MLSKLKDYYMIISIFVMALLAYLYQRQGSKLKDVQEELVLKELDHQASRLEEEDGRNMEAYEKAKEKYDRLMGIYIRLRDASNSSE